ncbi:DEAD/DEAH box helicase [Ferrimonas balearica]|uniref:DEAD/DEAH box helicase n=1 Tax=Ferrimonas balearica TaxID=44012 RepID=UPI001C587AE1|nr:DEAD/DEAH box helicase [Ferrimonas balearica]MBW3165159.1 DEAD/DEAH box helicase [Ferrimonas balearica]
MSIISEIKAKKSFNFNDTFAIYNACARTIAQNEKSGLETVVHILDQKHKFSRELDNMLADIVESVGFYPYLDKENLALSSTASLIRKLSQRSKNIKGKYLHDEQVNILDILWNRENLVVSAPTSFGKSLIIEEVVASGRYQNIVVIQPTLALLDETRRKLSAYKEKYKMILRTSQEPEENKGNVFLLTAERVNEYRMMPNVDLLIIDEFYKLSSRRDDERSDALNNAFNYLVSSTSCQFYLLGPNISGVSPSFLEKYNARFYKTDYSLVSCEEEDVYSEHLGKFGQRGYKKDYKENVLFELLSRLDKGTIVYCASPYRARYLASKYLQYLEVIGLAADHCNHPVLEWIYHYVSSDWSFCRCIRNGIGIHDGALQRHLTSTVIEMFNNGNLNILFCTTTIIEGVNTSAKNVIYFDKKKGKEIDVDFFDYSNIKGRAGRLMEHYVGRIYNFNPKPEPLDVYVDIPFFEQNPVSMEVLINIPEDEVADKKSEDYLAISEMSGAEWRLFSENAINIRGQMSLLSHIRNRLNEDYSLLNWSRTPSYDQLEYVLGLAWDHLMTSSEKDKSGRMTQAKLVKVTYDYGYSQSIKGLISSTYDYYLRLNKNDKEKEKPSAMLMDDAIRDSFQILRHWFQYKVPKWLMVVNEIQSYVCRERGLRSGSYTYYANIIENDFVRENLVVLSEYGIPNSAIKKLEGSISPQVNQDEVISTILENKLYDLDGLLTYERDRIIKCL